MTKTVDNNEVNRFSAIASDWWNPRGKFRPLHLINPIRLHYIREQLASGTRMDGAASKPFSGLRILDIGCGGGLVAEPLARLGATVTGIDPSSETIAIARSHAERQGLDIDYIAATVEELALEGRSFDCVLALEVVEHVPDVLAFLKCCASVAVPSALLVLSTLNRTPQSFALGIVAAEYLLGWLPKDTHQWNRFVTPGELREKLSAAGFNPIGEKGVVFNALSGEWKLSDNCSVNYFSSAIRCSESKGQSG